MKQCFFYRQRFQRATVQMSWIFPLFLTQYYHDLCVNVQGDARQMLFSTEMWGSVDLVNKGYQALTPNL